MSRARLTFNQPALHQYFDEDKRGMEIQINGDAVYFRQSNSSNALPLEDRGLIGKQVYPGILFHDILEVFEANGFCKLQPFFVMKQENNGWVKLIHHSSWEAPKTVPNLRVWLSTNAVSETLPINLERFEIDVQAVLASVDNLRETVSLYDSQRSGRRPPKVIREAKIILQGCAEILAA